MYQGWKVGLQLYVTLKKKSTRGILLHKKGTKWLFRPNGWKKSVSICPIRFRWHYVNHDQLKKWSQKLPTILIQSNLTPFKLKRERIQGWTGAATTRTKICLLPVWQILDTNKVIVGHLGLYRLASANKGKLTPCTDFCPSHKVFIGRGSLDPKRFKCLKTTSRQKPPKAKRTITKPLYSVPTREELSVGF